MIKSIFSKLTAAQKELKDIERQYNRKKEEVEKLREEMIQEMIVIGTTTYNGSGARMSLRSSIVPRPKNWDEIYQYILETKSFDLLHQRLSSTAFRDRLENDENIPGIETWEKKTLYITLEK